MKRFPHYIAALVIATLFVPVFSQMSLNSIYSRGVSSGKSAVTKIDSVLVDTKVGNGVATTILTMTVTPDIYKQCTYYSTIIDSVITWDTAIYTDTVLTTNGPDQFVETRIDGKEPRRVVQYLYTYGYKCSETGEVIDSVEISASFALPSDFVVKNLYLWVNGERQTGYIQDRALANQQYNQIVGKRRDPAILEFWGNGQYNLRIFPAKSLVSRKVAIEFQHTFDDDSFDLISASLPLQFDTAYYYSNVSDKKYRIGFMRVTASAGDARSYFLDVPGVGSGSFSSNTPLVIEKNDIEKVSAGSIESKDPSGQNEFLWAAVDKNSKTTLGFSTMLSKSSVVLEPEPDTRIIVLDIQNETWNYNDYYTKYYQYTYPWNNYTPYEGYKPVDVMLRAKKSAILCLQTYVAQNQKFNVVLTQPGSQKPVTVFENPVAPTEENLAIAYQAIVNAKLSASTSQEALTKAVAQAPKGIVIFISDLYQPYDYGKYTDKNYSQYIISDAGKQFDSLIAGLSRTVSASQILFYTIGDEYKLTQITVSSGGYNLASLRWDSYYRKILYTVDGQQQTTLQLPPLFGYYYYGQPIAGLKVTAPENVAECVSTTDGYRYYYYDLVGARGGMELMAIDKKKALAKASMLVSPYRYYGDSTMFRLAAKLTSSPSSGTLDFIITGKMGGLAFTKKVTADASALQGTFDAADQYGLWAFRKTEQLGMTNWSQNADSIRWIGLDHHIVTRQTSLLALEPGMELWKDTINPSSNESSALIAGTADQKRSYGDSLSSSMNLDGISLQDIIAKKAAVLDKNITRKIADVSMRFSKAGLKIYVPQNFGGQELVVSLFTLQGRLIMTKRVATTKGSGTYAVHFGTKMACKGIYLIKVKIGSVEKVLSIPVF